MIITPAVILLSGTRRNGTGVNWSVIYPGVIAKGENAPGDMYQGVIVPGLMSYIHVSYFYAYVTSVLNVTPISPSTPLRLAYCSSHVARGLKKTLYVCWTWQLKADRNISYKKKTPDFALDRKFRFIQQMQYARYMRVNVLAI